jgi:dihydrofolate reductase
VKLAMIAAMGRNRVIGRHGKLPWHIPEDLRRFKRLTSGHPVLMGRKTYESLGKPLRDRRNVVLSSHAISGVETYSSMEKSLSSLGNEELVFVIGGGEVYAQLLPRADILYLTIIDREFEGDAFFPPYEHLLGAIYREAHVEQHEGFRFVDYVRMES